MEYTTSSAFAELIDKTFPLSLPFDEDI